MLRFEQRGKVKKRDVKLLDWKGSKKWIGCVAGLQSNKRNPINKSKDCISCCEFGGDEVLICEVHLW